ncbi:MAG: serine/threonine protein kinase [Candidatus Obscuribacterales bacterium]|nr:serine/threonine protein kinase [Candidatus Obscuribacterales bacterium]
MKELDELGIELRQQVSVTNFSTVYKARQSLLQRDVCVKVCAEGFLENSKERFLREAKILTELKHPNIAELFMYGTVEDRPFMVLEWLEGSTLQERNRSGRLTLEEARSIFGQLVDALTYTHKLGIVHRDLKPANVFLGAGGRVKLLDFGIARVEVNVCAQSTLTQTGVLVGSPAYMSPEQCQGLVAGPASDQYSLACLVYECVAGSFVFEGSSDMELMFKHVNEAPPLSKAASSARRVFRRALDKTVEKRYPSLTEFWKAVDETLPSFYASSGSKAKRVTVVFASLAVLFLVIVCLNLKHDSAVVEEPVPLAKSFTSYDLAAANARIDKLVNVEHKYGVALREIKRYLNKIPAPKEERISSRHFDGYTNLRAGLAGKFTAVLVAKVKDGGTLSPSELQEGEQMLANFRRWNTYTAHVDLAAAAKELADWNLYCKGAVNAGESQYRDALGHLDKVVDQSETYDLRNSIAESQRYIKAIRHQ